MTVTIRHMQAEDIPRVGGRHGSPPSTMSSAVTATPSPFPSPAAGTSIAQGYARLEPKECFTALQAGQIVGSGFLHLRGDTAGIGPITVDPGAQAQGAGRALMQTVIEAGGACPSFRLVQDAFNMVSFPLYSRLGFEVRGTIASLVGQHIQADVPGDVEIREWLTEDIEHLATLDTRLTGIVREQDIRFFHAQPPHIAAFVQGQLAGYLCFLRTEAGTFLGPAAATQPSVLRALILSAAEREQGKALRMRFSCAARKHYYESCSPWAFGLETLQTYMVRGAWQPPNGGGVAGAFSRSVIDQDDQDERMTKREQDERIIRAIF